jgi:hypothetical protein
VAIFDSKTQLPFGSGSGSDPIQLHQILETYPPVLSVYQWVLTEWPRMVAVAPAPVPLSHNALRSQMTK